jgi:hypothetical protein
MKLNIIQPIIQRVHVPKVNRIEPVQDRRDALNEKMRKLNNSITRARQSPLVLTQVVENAAPTKWVFVFDEAVAITNATGWALLIDDVAGTISGVIGTGTDTLTFTTTETVLTGEVLTVQYIGTAGNVTSVASSDAMSNITTSNTKVTNNTV